MGPPTGEASPTDFAWKLNQNCFEPDWFPGSSVQESLTTSTPEDTMGTTSTDDEESDNTWSDVCDNSDENEEEVLMGQQTKILYWYFHHECA